MQEERQGEVERTVLVAGATGYLGGYVVRALQDRGLRVRALVRSPHKLRGLEPDEVVRGEVTRPETLTGACDGVEAVFSCVGITRQQDGLTWRDVDYQGNLNLLRLAQHASVRRFVYVSVFGAGRWRHLDIAAAHEDFVDALRQSDMDWHVLRPTGYFSDLETFLDMARRGRVYLFGSGCTRVNPIHGAGLAALCADVVSGHRTDREVDVGGPEIFTWNEIAELALQSVGRPQRVTRLPLWTVDLVSGLLRWVSRHRCELLRFFAASGKADFVAPRYGTRSLRQHYAELAES